MTLKPGSYGLRISNLNNLNIYTWLPLKIVPNPLSYDWREWISIMGITILVIITIIREHKVVGYIRKRNPNFQRKHLIIILVVASLIIGIATIFLITDKT